MMEVICVLDELLGQLTLKPLLQLELSFGCPYTLLLLQIVLVEFSILCSLKTLMVTKFVTRNELHQITNCKLWNWLSGGGKSEGSLGFLSLTCPSEIVVIFQLSNVPSRAVA